MSTLRILKYSLSTPNDFGGGRTQITCQFNRFLDIQTQGGSVVVWIETDSDAETKTVNLIALGTGWEFPSDAVVEYVKTVQDDHGYVWHYYVEE